MDWNTFLFDCREIAKQGVITHSQIKDLFFEVENANGREFAEKYPEIKQKLEEIGMRVEERI